MDISGQLASYKQRAAVLQGCRWLSLVLFIEGSWWVLSKKAETVALKVVLEMKGLYYIMGSWLKPSLGVQASVGLR